MPTTLRSDAYEFVVDFDFLTQAPPGGAYYAFVDSAGTSSTADPNFPVGRHHHGGGG